MNSRPIQADIDRATAAFVKAGGVVEQLPDGPVPLLAFAGQDPDRAFGILADALGMAEIYSKPAATNLIGQTFGFLTARRFVEMIGSGKHDSVWWFRCACGNTVKRTMRSVKTSLGKGYTPRCKRGCMGGEGLMMRGEFK